MNRLTCGLSSVLVATAGLAGSCLANNNLFLPGDAFFPTVLTKAEIEALNRQKAGERQFRYSSLGGYEGAFCGYAGYSTATIPAVDDAFFRNLLGAYQMVREVQPRELIERQIDGKMQLVETNGIPVLFYPPAFTFPKHALGLRYNENWVAECMKFGHRREDLRLCCLVPDPEAVAVSWRDADLVPALKVKLPEGIQLQPVPETDAPVVVQGPVKAIVLGTHSLKELFHAGERDLTLFIVDSKGIARLDYHEGDWKLAAPR